MTKKTDQVKCRWNEYHCNGYFSTCDRDFQTWEPNEKLTAIGFKYCPFCGKEIEEINNGCDYGCGNIAALKSPIGGKFCKECAELEAKEIDKNINSFEWLEN